MNFGRTFSHNPCIFSLNPSCHITALPSGPVVTSCHLARPSAFPASPVLTRRRLAAPLLPLGHHVALLVLLQLPSSAAPRGWCAPEDAGGPRARALTRAGPRTRPPARAQAISNAVPGQLEPARAIEIRCGAPALPAPPHRTSPDWASPFPSAATRVLPRRGRGAFKPGLFQ